MKKQVYVVTYYSGNYGSALQAYALQQALNELGADPFIILPPNPNKKNISLIERLKSFLEPEKNYNLFLKVRRKLERNTFKKRNDKIYSFIEKNTKTITYLDFITKVTSEDKNKSLCIAGSDQIWSTINGPIRDFYLFNGIEDIRKASYAVSLGQQDFEENQLNYYKETLKEFEWISIRERKTCDILRDYFKTGNIRCDIDPTLLLSVNKWKKIVGKKLFDEPYVFVYMLRPDHTLIEMAKQLSCGRKIIFMGQFNYRYKGVISVIDSGVDEFLSAIYYADYIITNSFHGTLFSILFNKKFVSVKIASTSSRVENLLEMTDLRSHLISKMDEIGIAKENYNYKECIERLNLQKSQSVEYLTLLLS